MSVEARIYITEKELMRTLKVGTKLGGYQLLGLIARGGMGAVYEAQEIALDRRVALKVIAPPNPDDHDSEELVQRFMQEARTLAKVNNPHVITIFAIDTSEGVPFITMELVEGISFKELLAVSFLSADLAAPMFVQMLEGVQSLHANRIVHRDLKPHNVMVRKDGQIKILDFGIAKPVDSGNFTHVGVVVGSLAYMAPEVKLGIAASERSDLWNLGAIFYECLTGKSLPKVQADHPHAKDIPYAANSPIPFDMRAIIAKLCHHRPLERYENCAQAIEDLKAFQRKRTPVTPDVMQAFARKVEEILNKRRGDSRDMPAADITPIKAATMPVDAPQTIAEMRERPFAPRDRRKKKSSHPRLVAAGFFAALVLLAVVLKPKFEAQKTVAPQPPPPTVADVPKAEEPSPIQFKPPAVKLPLELTSPAADETVTLDPAQAPEFTWSEDVKAGEYAIQVAGDRAFRKILIDEEVSGTSYRPSHPLADGRYYWRLWPKGVDGRAAGPVHFKLSALMPVTLQTPRENAEFEYGAREAGAGVDFRWACVDGAQAYQIQIALGPKFIPRENGTTACALRERALVAGLYRWRVRASGKPWSDSREFTVTKKAAVPLKPVAQAPVKPEAEPSVPFTMRFKGQPRDLASVAKSIAEYPVLNWKPVKGAKKYLVQISTTKDFAKPVTEEAVSDPRFEWKGVMPGVYFWRVATLTDKPGPVSDPEVLSVTLPAPKLKPKYKFETLLEGDRQVVNWAFVPLAEKYAVQFGARRDLAASETVVTNASKFPVPKKHGQYFLRVAAANGAGTPISAYSSPAAVSVEPVATLETPIVKFPKNGAAAVARNGRLVINFEWTKVPKCERYVIELAHDEDFSEVIAKVPSMENTHVMKKLEAVGQVYWRVRAESREGVSNWSEASYFEVRK